MIVSRWGLGESLGGFDEELSHLADADFCLRAKRERAWIVWTPFAVAETDGPTLVVRTYT